ncbi:MAG: lipoate--protein ligase [Ruminococcaceae bacterium]|nr:lipoate--protein ligase [Oscillospiraceae bacterium]
MINKLQYYMGTGFDPYKNLAIEKHLLDTVADDAVILYLWQNKNTVVIGKNQNPWAECRTALLEEEGGHLARRLSGGGAVFHDLGNLNFTFICNTRNYDLTRQLEVIRTACSQAGIETEISGRNDILADGRKFSGNAFYNSKGKSYHHGTLLISADTEQMGRYLTPSKAKLATKGVKSVKSRVVNLSELSANLTCESIAKYMLCAFEDVYGLKAEPVCINNSESIMELAKQYSSWEYIYGISIPFSFSCEERFNWGSIEIQLQVTNGIIQAVKAYSDSMDWQIAELIESALTGKRFELRTLKNSICEAISAPVAADICRLLEEQEL